MSTTTPDPPASDRTTSYGPTSDGPTSDGPASGRTTGYGSGSTRYGSTTDLGSPVADDRSGFASPNPAHRFDPLALVFGLLFLGFAGLALDGRPLDLSLAFLVPAALAGLAVWLVVSAITGRERGTA